MNKVKRASQFGRSMIEMLGVLAIIGVLSVGGISGYTEAMHKYKMNKTIEIVRASLFRLEQIDQNTNKWAKFEEIWADSALFVALGLLPEDICDKNYVDIHGRTGRSCQLPVGEIDIDVGYGDGMPIYGEYEIRFTKGDRVRNCVDFLSYHWEKITPKDWWNPTVSDWEGGMIEVHRHPDGHSHVYAGKKEKAEELHTQTELTMDNIAKTCNQQCKNENDLLCSVMLVFRNGL